MNGNLDHQLLLSLNSLFGSDIAIWKLANNPLFRGLPVFFSLIALWFVDDCGKRRSRMLIGLLAVCVATVLSVWLQVHFASHIRPVLDRGLPLKVANSDWASPVFWDHSESFPSDTATLFFGLSTLIVLEHRLIGFLCFLWVVLIVAIPRVIFGWHYPSDIVGSVILGPGCVVFFNAIPYLRMLVERVLTRFEGRMYFVHALLFFFLAEASNLFYSLEKMGKLLVKISHS